MNFVMPASAKSYHSCGTQFRHAFRLNYISTRRGLGVGRMSGSGCLSSPAAAPTIDLAWHAVKHAAPLQARYLREQVT